MRQLQLTDDHIIKWGELFTADAVIYGRCNIVDGEGVSMLLTAFDVGKGNKIYEGNQIARVDKNLGRMDQTLQLLEKAVGNIATQFGPAIIQSIQLHEPQVIQLSMELRELRSFDQFRRFKAFLLNDVEGVTSVVQTRILGNSMSILVEFSGKKDMFLERMSKQKNFSQLVDAITTEQDEIVLKVK
jgi:hypothetical protein